MSQSQHRRAPILVAIPDKWRTVVCQIVEHYGFPVLSVLSHHEAVQFASDTHLSGIIVVSDWTVPSTDGADPGVVTIVKHRIPTITLVRKSNDLRWFESAYERPLHEYFTIPFSADEVVARMQSTGMLTKEEMDERGSPDMSQYLNATDQ